MEKKMTYVQALEIAISAIADGEAKDKLIALKGQHEKKSTAERKPSKAQIENANTANAMLAEMVSGEKYRISDIVANFASVSGLSPNKVSALMRTLKESGAVVRTEEKRVAYFSKVEA